MSISPTSMKKPCRTPVRGAAHDYKQAPTLRQRDPCHAASGLQHVIKPCRRSQRKATIELLLQLAERGQGFVESELCRARLAFGERGTGTLHLFFCAGHVAS